MMRINFVDLKVQDEEIKNEIDESFSFVIEKAIIGSA